MAGPTFLGDLGYALAAPGQVIDNYASEYDVVIIEDDERLRRRLESNNSTEDDASFDLSKYLQFCGVGLRNAQLYERSQLEVRRNQVLLDLAGVIFQEQSTIDNMIDRILTHMLSLIR